MAISTGQRALALEAHVGSALVRRSCPDVQKQAIAFYLSRLWLYNHLYRMNILEDFRILILGDGYGWHLDSQANFLLLPPLVSCRWLSDKGDL